jgi:hypothetical protein
MGGRFSSAATFVVVVFALQNSPSASHMVVAEQMLA